MLDSIQPPTDNLYKFLAIGGLVFALVIMIYLLREQSRLREQYMTAQVELQAQGYQEGSGEPSDPDVRRSYFRRQLTLAESKDLLKLAGGKAAPSMGVCGAVSLLGFFGWWLRVQRYDDEILRLTVEKLKSER